MIRLPLICHICGDKARGLNFDVITCLSCKAFFRRNAFRQADIRPCQHKQSCVINRETRSRCPTCRLNKCYAYGMDPSLIQSVTLYESKRAVNRRMMLLKPGRILLPLPEPVNLLQRDNSLLTDCQWNIISNMIRSYDERNVICQVRYILEQKSSLPPKLRLKPSDTMDLMSKPLESIIPLMERGSHFRNLSPNAYRTVICHNVFTTGGLNGYLVARETNQFQDESYMLASGSLYGIDYMKKCAQDGERLETNGNLVKIMLFVLIFSSNCSMVVFNDQEDLSTASCSLELLNIQNIYVSLLWKYMNYLYGHDQAVVRFASLIKTVLDMLVRIEELSTNITLKQMIHKVKTNTESALANNDTS